MKFNAILDQIKEITYYLVMGTKLKKSLILIIFLFGFQSFIYCDIEAKNIASKYYQGVVKILLYDPALVSKFKLDKDEGYLTRGSGFFVTPDGVIFTNRHVVEWCVYGYIIADWVDENKRLHELDVLTYSHGLESDPKIKRIYFVSHAIPIVQVFHGQSDKDFKLYRADVLTIGESFDGAMLKLSVDIDGKPIDRSFTYLPLGDASQVPMGEDLVILGFPAQYQDSDLALDLRDTITMSFGRQSGWDFVFDEGGLIKTDASIHEGNSGGPVFAQNERVIGIATAMGVKTQIGLIEGINNMYYIASTHQEVLSKLIANGLVVPSKEASRIQTVSGSKKPLPQIKLSPLNGNNSQKVTIQRNSLQQK